MQEKGRMKLDEGYQEDLESMDHKSPELLALACGVLSGWWLSGWFRYSHPDATPPAQHTAYELYRDGPVEYILLGGCGYPTDAPPTTTSTVRHSQTPGMHLRHIWKYQLQEMHLHDLCRAPNADSQGSSVSDCLFCQGRAADKQEGQSCLLPDHSALPGPDGQCRLKHGFAGICVVCLIFSECCLLNDELTNRNLFSKCLPRVPHVLPHPASRQSALRFCMRVHESGCAFHASFDVSPASCFW
eukprot:CAMPEP_0174308936 /NCGR_PEP_ID=MMETSP0810-20121108/2072_1 /TAXON_ID=73025 ORGANISM="Eutreptiella gymnastica-like, Strain CCMP1594" /NCGR_SAMPLE_ID=MMETSP0810 /ASSEMBLY_ACC=CAM_ASM_000659 /LENGTH=242 /DNA_ID=CAMNT_0015416395 /DNA_START=590 /DNA_END=1322 /DNA_ORIENTATION=+